LGSRELAADTHITIKFEDGRMEGDAGCRAYRGLYQAEGDQIAFPTFSMMGDSTCSDEALLAQEMLFTDYLELSTHYQVDGDRLELYTATGETMVFVKE
jgi:heat shock protein HslJ